MANRKTPMDFETVTRELAASGIKNVGQASIREIKKLIDTIEKASGQKYIRMEMGIPGLPPVPVGVEAQIEALKKGVAAIYPDIQGIPELKTEIARFVKLFLDIEVNSEHCLPTVGSMMGGLACFMTLNRMHADREGTLFIDPGFPVQKLQCKILGQGYQTFDVYEHRGPKLREKLLSYLKTGKVSTIMYSNPNNPSWICFTDEELRIIGELATEYDVVVVEDLAYFGMDFRKDYSRPGQAPYQPTVAKYTDNYALLISSSKAFSYAGERIAMLVLSDALWNKKAPDLKRFYSSDQVGNALVFGTIYGLSSGTSHSAQYALAAILKAVNDGTLNFVDYVKEYGEKAKVMKKLFTENGFQIVYDQDLGDPIADGFYFTISYPGLAGDELLKEFVYYGISAIALATAGSEHTEGLRACTSLIQRSEFPILEERLKQFRADHPLS
jgi:aspartate/methionine/tyrosine aminotransferase